MAQPQPKAGSLRTPQPPQTRKPGYAIIHDKILVTDPFSDQCLVATDSHNLEYKASYNNDENLMIIQGDKKLATAYATHVLDIYDHFSFRYWMKHSSSKRDY